MLAIVSSFPWDKLAGDILGLDAWKEIMDALEENRNHDMGKFDEVSLSYSEFEAVDVTWSQNAPVISVLLQLWLFEESRFRPLI